MPKFSFLLMFLFLSLSCLSQPPLETVGKVDLQKYSGLWYEMCHLPARFLDGCECITATYSIDSRGFVKVYNKCKKSNGKWISISGKAFSVQGSGNSKLKVQFFWPFRSDYYIIDLADDYSYAIVGEPGRNYLWILSRTPKMNPDLYQSLVKKCGNKGFPVEFLEVTSHGGCE